jgi:RNA polymerase sigma factor (sigma-70 family)
MYRNKPSRCQKGETEREGQHGSPSEHLLALILRAQQGEVAAEHDLFAQLTPMIRGALATYRQDVQIHEELQGQVYLLMHRLVQKFDPQRNVNAFTFMERHLSPAIRSIVRQRQEVARREIRWSELRTAGAQEEADKREDPEENLERRIRTERGWQRRNGELEEQTVLRLALQQALLWLPTQQRQTVLLRAQGHSFAEIATIVGMNADNCRQTYKRAVKQLRELLDEK